MLQETAITRAITKLSDVRSKFNLTRSADTNQYALSDLFSLSNSRNNGLDEAMRVLKRLTSLSLQDS